MSFCLVGSNKLETMKERIIKVGILKSALALASLAQVVLSQECNIAGMHINLRMLKMYE